MPRQVDHRARLAAIQDAVEDLAAREGFSAVTIRRIAAHAGASTSIVTHYVPSRDELVRAVVRRGITARQTQLDDLVGNLRGADGLRAVAQWAVLGPTDQSHRFWLAIVLGARSDSVLRTELDAFNQWWCALLGRLVNDMNPDPIDPCALIDAIDVVVDGMILAGFEEQAPWPDDRRRRTLDLLLAPLGI